MTLDDDQYPPLVWQVDEGTPNSADVVLKQVTDDDQFTILVWQVDKGTDKLIDVVLKQVTHDVDQYTLFVWQVDKGTPGPSDEVIFENCCELGWGVGVTLEFTEDASKLTGLLAFMDDHKLWLGDGTTPGTGVDTSELTGTEVDTSELTGTEVDASELTAAASSEVFHKLCRGVGVIPVFNEEDANGVKIGVGVDMTYWVVYCAPTGEETTNNHFISRFKPRVNYCGSNFYACFSFKMCLPEMLDF